MDIFLVEDNEIIGDAIVSRMVADGNTVEWRKSVASALAAEELEKYDCAVLDLRLPDGHGFSVLDAIRQRGFDMPVLVLTAFDQITDQMAGMARGADDYLVKPFSLAELSRRVAMLAASGPRPFLRRHGRPDIGLLAALTVDAAASAATVPPSRDDRGSVVRALLLERNRYRRR